MGDASAFGANILTVRLAIRIGDLKKKLREWVFGTLGPSHEIIQLS
jgi:hypothetical protein